MTKEDKDILLRLLQQHKELGISEADRLSEVLSVLHHYALDGYRRLNGDGGGGATAVRRGYHQ